MTYNILAQVNPRHHKYYCGRFLIPVTSPLGLTFFLFLYFVSLPHPGAHRHLECLSREGQAHRTGSQYCARHQLQSCARGYVLLPLHNHP